MIEQIQQHKINMHIPDPPLYNNCSYSIHLIRYIGNIASMIITMKCPQIQSQRICLSKFPGVFLRGMSPDPQHQHAMHADCAALDNCLTIHHPKFSIHTALIQVGLTIENLLPMALPSQLSLFHAQLTLTNFIKKTEHRAEQEYKLLPRTDHCIYNCMIILHSKQIWSHACIHSMINLLDHAILNRIQLVVQ